MPETTIALPWPQRTLIELRGNDRASFLHNLCTNEIKVMQPGDSCEAFITNVQGKTIGHVIVGCQEDRLLLTTVPDQGDTLMAHLDRYLITEDVQLADKTAESNQCLAVGSKAAAVLNRVFCIDAPEGISCATFQDQQVIVWRMPYTADDCFAVGSEQGESLHEQLTSAGAVAGTCEDLERRRIGNCFPWFGTDITESNLPQELSRESASISFTKGCYLGQETVARIDALGHVNKLLCRLKSHAVLSVGAELTVGEKVVGSVTSSVPAGDAGTLGLGFVRREHAEPGTKLTSSGKDVVVG